MLAAAVVLTLVFALMGGQSERHFGKFAGGDPDMQQSSSAADTAGEGPIGGYDQYLAAAEAYPAATVTPTLAKREQATFGQLADKTDSGAGPRGAAKWSLYGPTQDATQPGVTAFSGATNNTASRDTALVVSPTCGEKGSGKCRVWVGASGGGVWRTDDATSASPSWKQVNPAALDQTSVGVLTLDPTDKQANTLYLGTGEPNRCSSGCEAGVGVYKSTNGGNSWKKLPDTCVSNATYPCANPGADAFLGRGISSIVIDPTNKNHILVGSARAVRGMSHVIGNGGQTSSEPGANEAGLYESFDGGNTFTEVWNGAKPDAGLSSGITNVALDPSDPSVVYASAFDAGIWRRDSGAAATAFNQVFKPQFAAGSGIDRTAFALTTKNGHTRAYVYDGTANGNGVSSPTASNFWRTDMADQSSASLLASQGATCTPPDPTTHTFPATYTGWACLTSKSTANPYFATDDLCTGQCWYDNFVYTPPGQPDTVYLLGSMEYGEQPCNTNGVGCGNGRSNGRAVVYSDTAGDPDAANNMRTFTDMTMDATINHPSWCAFAPYFDNGCENAPNGIHPDEHVIAVNPSNPTQFFEGSDGGMVVTSGQFANVSSQCDSQYRNGGGPLPTTSGSYLTCQRMLSRVPTTITHIDRNLSSTLQFINVAIDPFDTNDVLGGTQDNGTWSNLGNDPSTFSQVIYGDGGNAVFDGSHQGWMANEFTGGFGDVNFENGDPTKWVIATGPIVASGEAVAFYWPQIGDPNPVTYNGQVTHPLYEGAQHVWRSWAFGAGHTGDVPQDTSPDISSAEANCPEFVTSGATPTCGDFMPLGGPAGSNKPGDLTGTTYGTDRTGGSISWLARDSGDHGTLWAATSAGRIFVTHNADATNPADVNWVRIDSSTSGASPTRFPSSIYVDASNPNHAWISYSGYNANTPSTPGHVFSVTTDGTTTGGGAFTNLNVEAGTSGFPTPNGDGDLPVADVVQDASTHTLYVATDFGVLSGNDDGTGAWRVMAGMPRYEIMHLAIEPSSREATCAGGGSCPHVLYAATHSQGIWRTTLK